jgi:triphosphatase
MTETELKLEILASDLDTLLASGLLGAPTEVIDQRSTYFDTSNHRLFSAGFTLRIRHSGAAWMQTVEATGASASLFARSEWEVPVTGNAPVLDHSTPLLNAFGPIGSELSPRFVVCIQRRLWIVKENESTIEAVIDTGRAKAGDRQTPIVEMELELKDGDARDLFTLARKIDTIVPYKFGVISKAERGYRLLQALSPAVKAEPIELERSMSMADAFPAIAGSCLRQFRLNEGIFLERKNAEALHQARISLRRLRSTLSVFKPLFPDETAQRMSDEFRWLAGVLGEARNIDVLLPKADILRAQLENVRATACADVVEALASPRTRTLMLDFQEWLRCGDYLDFTVTPDIARPGTGASAPPWKRSRTSSVRSTIWPPGPTFSTNTDCATIPRPKSSCRMPTSPR